MHPVRDERRDWCQQAAGDGQHLVQRRKGSAAVVGVRLPEARTAQADIPVGHILVHELHDRARGKGRLVRLEQPVGLGFHRGQARQHPAIQRGTRGDGRVSIAR